MHLAVIIKAEKMEELPTASELREAGFAVSSAVGPGRDEGGSGNAPPGRCVDREPDRVVRVPGGPHRHLPERQSP